MSRLNQVLRPLLLLRASNLPLPLAPHQRAVHLHPSIKKAKLLPLPLHPVLAIWTHTRHIGTSRRSVRKSSAYTRPGLHMVMMSTRPSSSHGSSSSTHSTIRNKGMREPPVQLAVRPLPVASHLATLRLRHPLCSGVRARYSIVWSAISCVELIYPEHFLLPTVFYVCDMRGMSIFR